MHTLSLESLSSEGTASNPLRSSCAADVTDALQEKGRVFLKVRGKSMFPWIREGDIVFLRHTGMREVARGDVVVFEKNGLLCVHRVLEIRGRAGRDEAHFSLITKGDATEDVDSPVSTGDFRGKVEFVYRRNKEIRIASGWRKHLGKVLAFFSPAVAWCKRLWLASSGDSPRCESSPLAPIDGQRSSENSAD